MAPSRGRETSKQNGLGVGCKPCSSNREMWGNGMFFSSEDKQSQAIGILPLVHIRIVHITSMHCMDRLLAIFADLAKSTFLMWRFPNDKKKRRSSRMRGTVLAKNSASA